MHLGSSMPRGPGRARDLSRREAARPRGQAPNCDRRWRKRGGSNWQAWQVFRHKHRSKQNVNFFIFPDWVISQCRKIVS